VFADANFALRARVDYVNAQDTQLRLPLPFIPPLRGLVRRDYQNQTCMGMVECARSRERRTAWGEATRLRAGRAVLKNQPSCVGYRFVARRHRAQLPPHVDTPQHQSMPSTTCPPPGVIKYFLRQSGRAIVDFLPGILCVSW